MVVRCMLWNMRRLGEGSKVYDVLLLGVCELSHLLSIIKDCGLNG